MGPFAEAGEGILSHVFAEPYGAGVTYMGTTEQWAEQVGLHGAEELVLHTDGSSIAAADERLRTATVAVVQLQYPDWRAITADVPSDAEQPAVVAERYALVCAALLTQRGGRPRVVSDCLSAVEESRSP